MNKENLIHQKKKLEQELRKYNINIKDLHFLEMQEVEKIKNLTIGCRIVVDTKESNLVNRPSTRFAEYLGIEDPYSCGLHQVKIGYQKQGCQYKTFYYDNICNIVKI